MRRQLQILSLFMLLIIPCGLSAEIVNVAVKWDGKVCKENCNLQLEKGFKRMPNAVGLNVDYKSGVATMRWMPQSKFQFQNISLVTRPVGVAISDVTLTVRGTVIRTGSRITLSSIGDDTPFILVPKPLASSKESANLNNYSSNDLDPRLLQILDSSEKGFYVITVTGKLLSPDRSPPNYLAVESIVSDAPAPASKTNQNVKDRLQQWQNNRANKPAQGIPANNTVEPKNSAPLPTTKSSP